MRKRDVIRAVQAVLSPDLLKADWRARLRPDAHPTAGHCYAAAEAAWHLWGRERGYRARVARYDGGTHWWLQHANGDVLDPTAEQFLPGLPPYDRGVPIGFLTGARASKRAAVIIARVRAGLDLAA
jgi:hypothetical protein